MSNIKITAKAKNNANSRTIRIIEGVSVINEELITEIESLKKVKLDKSAIVKTDIVETSNDTVYSTKESQRRYVNKINDDTLENNIDFTKKIETQGATEQIGVRLKRGENGEGYIDTDYLRVRKKMDVEELDIVRIQHLGGNTIQSPARLICARVEELNDVYRCFFRRQDNQGNEVYNQFVVDDLAMSKTYNVQGKSVEQSSYYWRAVVGVGDDYIDLSKEDCDEGSTKPQTDDIIVLCGNKIDPVRQNVIMTGSYGEKAPYIINYKGINNYSLPKEKEVFRTDSTGTYVKGTFVTRNGENIEDIKQPYIGKNGNWYTWNSNLQDFEDSKIKAKGERGERGLNGRDGKDAVAPRINEQTQNWEFWDGTKYVDSGFSSVGDDGHAPKIVDEFWHEWDAERKQYRNTNVQARGQKGDRGERGERGEKGKDGKNAEFNNLMLNSNFAKGFENWSRHYGCDTIEKDIEKGTILTRNGTDGGWAEVYQYIYVPKGKYTLSYDIKLNDTNLYKGWIVWRVMKNDRTLSHNIKNRIVPASTTAWQRFSEIINITEEGCYIKLGPTQTGTFNYSVTNFKLERGEEATPWTPHVTEIKGERGEKGAGLTFRGEYNANETYYSTSIRSDVVKYQDVFYIANKEKKEFRGIIPTNMAYWSPFGANFSSVATDLLLSDKAKIGDWLLEEGKIVSTLQENYGIEQNLDKITLDASKSVIKLESKYCQAFKSDKPRGAEIKISPRSGRLEFRSRGRNGYERDIVTRIGADGIFTNSAKELSLPGSSGMTHLAAVAGLGYGELLENMYRESLLYNEDSQILVGVYGNAYNSAEPKSIDFGYFDENIQTVLPAAAYGGYFHMLKARGLCLNLSYVDKTQCKIDKDHPSWASYIIDREETIIYFNNDRNLSVFLPDNPYVGQSIFFHFQNGAYEIELWGGIEREKSEYKIIKNREGSRNNYFLLNYGGHDTVNIVYIGFKTWHLIMGS